MLITFSDFYKAVGNIGRFQVFILVMGLLLCMYDSEMVTMVFVGGHMDHWCQVQDLESLPTDLQKKIAIPFLGRDGKRIANNGSLDKGEHYSPCLRYDRNYSNILLLLGNASDSIDDETWWQENLENIGEVNVLPCEKYAYSQKQFVSTIVSQYNLVCGLEYLVPLVSSLYMFGGLIGCLTAGYVSDAIGRKRTLLVNMVLRIASIGMFIFAPTIHVFMVGRFILGASGNAVRVTHFILAMEMFNPRHKTYVSTVLVIGLSVGAIFMSILAMFVRDHFLYQIYVFGPILLLFLYAVVLLPESPRWLHLNGKHKEVNKIWSRISFFNGRKLPDHIRSENLELPKKSVESKASELFTSKLLLIRIIPPGYMMMAGSLIYYAIILNISSLAGDIYTNSCISSAVEIPGYLMGLYFCNNKYTKRRLSLVSAMCIAGILQIICVPLMVTGYAMVNSALMLASRAFVCAAVLIMTIYSAELLPTQVRNTGFGFLMTCARIGSIIAPYTGKTLIEIWKPLPSAIYGTVSFTSGLLILLLPETCNEPVFDTIYELKVHNQSKRNSEEHPKEEAQPPSS